MSSRTPIVTSSPSAMAFFVGYAVAALALLLVGELRDTMGDFQVAFGLLGGLSLLMLVPIARLYGTAQR